MCHVQKIARPVVACAGPNFNYTTPHKKSQEKIYENFSKHIFP